MFPPTDTNLPRTSSPRTPADDVPAEQVPSAAGTCGVAIELRELCVSAGGQPLLENASAVFPAGQVTLIIGRSGAGKSLLLQLLAGTLDSTNRELQLEGSILFQRQGPEDAGEFLQRPATDAARPGSFRRTGGTGPVPPVGVVYQHFALFDELSPQANVRFARDHRQRSAIPREDNVSPEAVLTELGVPTRVRVSAMSGGQQQRLAIARTLAYAPEVILYDEPTSGLDAATSTQVAELLGRTHASHPRTSVIVTHDYTSLPAIADRIYLFDADARQLVLVPPEKWPQLAGMFASPAKPVEAVSAERETTPAPSKKQEVADRPPGLFSRMGSGLLALFEGTTRALEATVLLPWRLLPLYRSPKWGLRYFLHYLRLVAGPSAWLYLAVAGAIVGFVSTWFTFRHLPYAAYTEPLVIEDLLVAIGFALYRILVPVLATVLIAARCGAAVSADVGSRAWGKQLDAMRTFGAPPERYLLTGLLYAFLLGTPLLVGISFVVARLTSLLVFAVTHPQYGPAFWQLHFHQKLALPGESLYAGTGWLLAKTAVCAAGIGLIAWHRSARPPRSHSEVSSAVTVSILWSTLLVLVVQFAFSFLEFD